MVNCVITDTLVYQRSSPVFVQWKDEVAGKIFGLNFQGEKDASTFMEVLENAVQQMKNKSATQTTSGSRVRVHLN